MKRISFFVTAALVLACALSCKKSNSNPGNTGTMTDSSKSVLVKITLNPVPAANTGSFDGAISGLLPNLKDATWKVNGVTRSNEPTITFKQDDFQNGLLTLEATSNVNFTTFSFGATTLSNYPFTIHIEPTINGKITDSTTIRVTSTLTRTWNW